LSYLHGYLHGYLKIYTTILLLGKGLAK
jgi:hypothetical protein